jgi:LysM repeat protein
MTYSFLRPRYWMAITLLTASLGLPTVMRAQSGPLQEDIPPSTSVRTPRLRAHLKKGWSGDPGSDEGASDQEGQQQQGNEAEGIAPQISAPTPHKVFPYTVRPGDTPRGIAALFGVPLSDLVRLNHLREDSELMVGDTLRIPNPFLTRERELTSELDRLLAEKQAAEERVTNYQQTINDLRARVKELSAANEQQQRNLRILPWWRAAAIFAAGTTAVALVIMLVTVIQWLVVRSRFRAVAEMNESLRRLDYKYKAALAKAELRFQELYGRRRRGLDDSDQPRKTPEELEIEQLNQQLKEILERHLQRLDPSSLSAGRARWRERLADVSTPMEPRSVRR